MEDVSFMCEVFQRVVIWNVGCQIHVWKVGVCGQMEYHVRSFGVCGQMEYRVSVWCIGCVEQG